MLTELKVTDFLDKVAGSDPVPGGGSVAALSGALASALGAMVARLTVGKKNYEASWAEMERVAADLSAAREGFTADIDRDSEAYDRVFACFKMPKATDEEKAARSAAIQEATRQAALVPMEVARKAFALMPALAYVARNGNRNAVTDACVAMMCARTAVLGALLNVKINLSSIKDEAFVKAMAEEAARLEIDTMEQERNLLLYAKEKHGL